MINPNPNVGSVLMVFSVVSFVATFIVFLVMIFQNMYLKRSTKEMFNRIKMYQKKRKVQESALAKYKEEMGDHLTKLYPDYEKGIFENMNPKDAEQLNMLLVQYPELKFNGVLESYTGSVKSYLNCMYDYDARIEGTLDDIRDIYVNDWFIKFARPTIPDDIQKMLQDE
jgi:hypothetical protein